MLQLIVRQLVLMLLLFAAGTAAAETVYVSDLLRVGVRANPASNEAPQTVVTTGTALEVLERRDGYVRVRTPDNVEGWVNSVYVTGEKPARLRIKEMQKSYAGLLQELDELRAATTDLMDDKQRLTARVSELKKENGALHGQLSRLYQESAEEQGELLWVLFPLSLIGLFVFGVWLGIRWHRQRIAERFGGLEL